MVQFALNSSQVGYLRPIDTQLEDIDLDRFLHDLFVGVSPLEPKFIRPRWVPEPANLPNNETNWMAQGIIERREDSVASQIFDDTLGMIVNRNEEFTVLCSFYGPNCAGIAGLVRDGLSLDQNREVINSHNISLIKTGKLINTSALINEKWNKRVDLFIEFRRLLTRIYPVKSILSGNATVLTDNGILIPVDTLNIE